MNDAAPPEAGRAIVTIAWLTTVILAVVAVPAALNVSAFENLIAAFGLLSFAAGFVVWIVAFAQALVRSARGDDLAVSSWVFLHGSAPRAVRIQLLGAAATVLVITIATSSGGPFVWLTDLLPLGLAALWGARHGTFPARANTTGVAGGRPSK